MLEGVKASDYLPINCDDNIKTLTARKDTHQVKLLLELLIGIIDAKLFETVDIKCFKPERDYSN